MKALLSVPAVKAALPSRYRLAARRAFLRLSAITNAGARVECPCCGKHVRKLATRELHRVLARRGKAVIQVPPSDLERTHEDRTLVTAEERKRAFGQRDHVRICGADYGERLEAAGVEVTDVDPVERLEPAQRVAYGLRTGEPFYLCTKGGGR